MVKKTLHGSLTISSDCFGFLISCLWSFLSFWHDSIHSSPHQLWRYLQVHGEQSNYRALTFFLSFHLLNIIFSCMELLQLPQKCCMIRNGRENVRERIICFGCGPDGKRTIARFHHFLPCFAPFSPNLIKYLTWLRVALAFTKALTDFRNKGGSVGWVREEHEVPFCRCGVHPFPWLLSCCPR